LINKNFTSKPGDKVISLPRKTELNPVTHHINTRKLPTRGPASPMILIYGFLILDLIGTLLLMLPYSTVQNADTNIITALFTSTSAITVTGLTVVDTSVHWSFFGQAVIILLCFIGGLGFMTGTAFIIMITGQKLMLHNRLLVRDGLGWGNIGSITTMVRNTVIIAVILQIIGIIILFSKWFLIEKLWDGITWVEALWQSIFHGISAYNNAGFDIVPNQLGGPGLWLFSTDPVVVAILSVLILFGGIGYFPLHDLAVKRRFTKLQLETKIIFIFSAVLIVIGAGLFFTTEGSNPSTLGGKKNSEKLTVSIFQSISTRTAGFEMVDHSNIETGTVFTSTVLMIIGGASASTAGGIKINTFAIIVLAALSSLTGKKVVTAFKRQIPFDNVLGAVGITSLTFFALLFLAILLLRIEPNLPFEKVVFEIVSAFGTNGLSSGITSEFKPWSRFILIFAMFVGRFGPLTLVLLLAGRVKQPSYANSEERVRIG